MLDSSICLLVIPEAGSGLCGIICGCCLNKSGVNQELGLALALSLVNNLNFDHIATAHSVRAQLLQESVSFFGRRRPFNGRIPLGGGDDGLDCLGECHGQPDDQASGRL